MPRASWYSQLPPFGWFDPEDRPGSAAYQVGGRSIPDSQQGIALPTRSGLGKWYNVTPPGSDRPFPMMQTDIGPAKWTGRGVDISAAGAHQMGYTPKNFPTDANFKVEPIDTTGLGLAAGYLGGVPGENNTAVAQGPPQQRQKTMPQSLMDMFQAQNAAGEPVGFGDALTSRSNSLIGLGLGLLQPSNPLRGQSSWGNALEGYMGGAALDTRQAAQGAQLRHQKAQEARQAAQDRIARDQWERQFARGGESEFAKSARDLGLTPGTPEFIDMARKYALSKMEGGWTVQTDEETGQKFAYNPRTNETRAIPVPGATAAAPADPFAPGATPRPVYGVGDNYRAAAPAAAAAPTDGIPPPPPGVDRKEWKKEQTKLAVQRQIAAEAAKKAGSSIDPVTEDIDRSIAQISKYPGMTTGAFSSVLKKIPIVGGATQAGEVESLIKTVKASSSLEKLQQMRAQSPTGASGLGAVTQGEHALLQDAIGNLDQAQDANSVLYNLERVKRIRHEIVHGPGTAPPPRFAPPSYQQGPGAAAGGNEPVPVQSPGAARRLPSGTRIRLPDGRIGTVP